MKSKNHVVLNHKIFQLSIVVHFHDTYRITSDFKVETDIIASIAMSLIGRILILMIMNVKTFKTDVVFISIICHNVTSH